MIEQWLIRLVVRGDAMDTRSAPREELVRAAEAVVDAAVLFHMMRGGSGISPQTRGLLVRVILEDPLLTEQLFVRPEVVLH